MNQSRDSDDTKPNSNAKKFFRGLVIVAAWVLGFAGALGLIVAFLWVVSRCLNPAISDPAVFITANLLNALIFAAIVAQVVIYRKQWQIMERQWKNVAITERAYIGIERMRFIGTLAPNQPIRMSTIFRNGGKTPAWGFRVHYRMVVTDQTLSEAAREFPVEYEQGKGSSFIPAGQPKRVEMPVTNYTLNELHLIGVTHKLLNLFVFIEIEFKDFQDEWRMFPFCLRYNPDLDELIEGEPDE